MLYRDAIKLLAIVLIAILCIYPLGSSSPLEKEEPELQKFATFASSLSPINLQGQDVHQFNIKIRPFAPLITRCNGLLHLDRKVDTNTIFEKLQAMRVKYGLDPSNDKEIVRLKGYLASGRDFDNETGMYVSHILQALWNYMTWYKFLETTQNVKTETVLSEIFFYMQQNTEEKGGCFPGYAGRLMLLNGRFILEFQETLKICPTLFNELLQDWRDGKCIGNDN